MSTGIRWYKLDVDGRTPVLTDEPSIDDNRTVAKTKIGDVVISTVFLGLDHRMDCMDGAGPPIVFETMVFGGKLDHSEGRYSTWDDAVEGHENWVKLVKDSI